MSGRSKQRIDFSQKRTDINFRSAPRCCIRKTSFNYDAEYKKVTKKSFQISELRIHSISELSS